MQEWVRVERNERTMKKVYLSGKIAGLTEDEYRENFAQAAIAALDFFPDEQVTIVNPTTLPAIHNSWADYMIRDLMLLKDCDAIVMLTNWPDSIGARTEHTFAEGMGIDIHYLRKEPEMVLDQEQMRSLCERLKDSMKDFASVVIAAANFSKVELKDGMLRYANPPSTEIKEHQDE